MGGIDDSFFIAYWFPQVAVFDDINGWDTFDYNNVAEMYNEFGDFDVTITVPENFVIWATGELQNPESVLRNPCLEKYRKARSGKKIMHIIANKDIRKVNVTRKGKMPGFQGLQCERFRLRHQRSLSLGCIDDEDEAPGKYSSRALTWPFGQL